jgi:hypothetical protein
VLKRIRADRYAVVPDSQAKPFSWIFLRGWIYHLPNLAIAKQGR